jgi:hypothetical protein
MAVIVVGDSHARSFRACVDQVIEFGGHTMHIVGQFGVPNNLQAARGDHVLFCFGEVDVRVHLVKLAQQESVHIDAVISRVVGRYVERVRTFCNDRGAKGHVISAPPQAVPTTPEAVVPTVDTILERCARTDQVNRLLAQICAPDVNLIDMWGPFRKDDGALNMDMSDGIVHVADKFNDIIRDLVCPHLATPP